MKFWILTVLGVVACNPKNQQSTAVESGVSRIREPFLRIEDLKPPARMAEISASQLLEQINRRQEFFAAAPDREEAECDHVYNSRLKGEMQDGRLQFSGRFEIKSCALDNNGNILRNAVVKSYTVFGCEGGKLQDLVGADLEAALQNRRSLLKAACEGADEIVQQQNVEIFGEFVFTLAGIGELVKSTQVLAGLQDGNNQPCIAKREGDVYRTRGCSQFTIESVSSAKLNERNVTPDQQIYLTGSFFRRLDGELTFTDLRDMFYASGTTNFQLNDWIGTMQYNGAESSPKWSASREGESTQGVFVGPAPE